MLSVDSMSTHHENDEKSFSLLATFQKIFIEFGSGDVWIVCASCKYDVKNAQAKIRNAMIKMERDCNGNGNGKCKLKKTTKTLSI